MNGTKRFQSGTLRWVCLALVVVGCNGISGGLGEQGDDEDVREGQFGYTEHQPDTWLSGCVGAPDGICQSTENNFNCAPDCSCGE